MNSGLNNLLRILMLVLVLTVASNGNAMPGPTSGPATASPPAGSPSTGGSPPCWTPPCVPIDGGIGILLAAGAFVGARKLYRGTRG